jgi:hypothetical protein
MRVTRRQTTNRFWLYFGLVAMVFAVVVLAISSDRFLGVVWLVLAAICFVRAFAQVAAGTPGQVEKDQNRG